MRVRMVVDPTWGDNGKGKVADYLLNGPWSGEVDINCRWNGGANAGHRVMRGKQAFNFHAVPVSVLAPGVYSLIGPNCVVNLEKLFTDELPNLEKLGADLSRLRIAQEAFVLMPWHLTQEKAEKEALGGTGLGTTMNGIGPAYADITGRHALRIGDLLDPEVLRSRLNAILPVKNLLPAIKEQGWTVDSLTAQFALWGQTVKKYVVELDAFLQETLGQNGDSKVLCLEGAQGAALDVYAPNYPYNTSSGCTAYDAAKIFRMQPENVEYGIGVTKPYCTSVGYRVFPTKMADEVAERIRQAGDEYGVSTGRPRDCGWLDLPMLRYGRDLMWITDWFITKLDVLDNEKEILVCTHYERGGEKLAYPPRYGLQDCTPVYKSFSGWCQSTRGITWGEDLPDEADELLNFIELETGCSIIGISTGPEPQETIWIG